MNCGNPSSPRNATGDEPENSKILGPNTDSSNFFLMCVSKGEAKPTEMVPGALRSREIY